jgi:hypothetical protein
MKLQFKYPALNEKIKSNNSPEFKYSLTQIAIGDMYTLRMLKAIDALYNALSDHVIVVSSDRYKIECLDFVEVFSELTNSDKETRITPQWERVFFLAQVVAYALSRHEDQKVAIEWQGESPADLPMSDEHHG